MQSIIFKKYVWIILLGVCVNILIFIFWWLVTDPSNYIWDSISETAAQNIVISCNKLFLMRYYTSFVLINAIGLAFVLFQIKRTLSLSIIAFALLFYGTSNYFFSPFIGKNYFIIFINQRVSKGFYLEPVQDSGKNIGPFLLEHLASVPSYTREQAARGLGYISYTEATEKLNQLLNDSTESTNMRAECYLALKKMKGKESKQLLEDFSIRQITKSDALLSNKINYLEEHETY